jgi:glycogen operon protein
VDDSFLILVNAADEGVEYVLPEPPNKSPWRQVLDTENIENPFSNGPVDQKVILGGRSIRVYSDGAEDPAKSPVRYKLTRTL